MDDTEFDGCARACTKANAHTLVWGECANAARPEPHIDIGPRAFRASDGELSVGFDSYTLTELAEHVETALRTVPVRLGPNALVLLERGETVGLSGGEYAAMALAVAGMLAGEVAP